MNKIGIAIEAAGSAFHVNRSTEDDVYYLTIILADKKDFRAAVKAMERDVLELRKHGLVNLVIVAFPVESG